MPVHPGTGEGPSERPAWCFSASVWQAGEREARQEKEPRGEAGGSLEPAPHLLHLKNPREDLQIPEWAPHSREWGGVGEGTREKLDSLPGAA